MKIIVRAKFFIFNADVHSKAKIRPRTFTEITARTVNLIVIKAELKKRWSDHNLTKFSRPTNIFGFAAIPSHSKNARTIPLIKGMMTTVIKIRMVGTVKSANQSLSLVFDTLLPTFHLSIYEWEKTGRANQSACPAKTSIYRAAFWYASSINSMSSWPVMLSSRKNCSAIGVKSLTTKFGG